MKRRMTLLCLAICLTHSSLVAAEVASLRIAHAILIEAFNSGDLARMETSIHPQALGFFRLSQFPVQLTRRNGIKELGPAIAADLAKFATTDYESEYFVVGDTGIVLNRVALTPKDKWDKEIDLTFSRLTYVYANSGGRWVLVSWHNSDAPLKRK